MDLFPLKLTGDLRGCGTVSLLIASAFLLIVNVLLIAAYVFVMAYAAAKGWNAA